MKHFRPRNVYIQGFTYTFDSQFAQIHAQILYMHCWRSNRKRFNMSGQLTAILASRPPSDECSKLIGWKAIQRFRANSYSYPSFMKCLILKIAFSSIFLRKVFNLSLLFSSILLPTQCSILPQHAAPRRLLGFVSFLLFLCDTMYADQDNDLKSDQVC